MTWRLASKLAHDAPSWQALLNLVLQHMLTEQHAPAGAGCELGGVVHSRPFGTWM